MSRNLLIALVLIALTVVVLLMNAKGTANLNLVITSIRASAAMVYLGFTSVGVIIGILLR